MNCEKPGCEREATRVMGGANVCDIHTDNQPEVALVKCAMDGCKSPVGASGRWCTYHEEATAGLSL